MKIFFIGQINIAPLASEPPETVNPVAVSRGHQIVEGISEKPDLVICYNWSRQSN
jgi:hypothetical protein